MPAPYIYDLNNLSLIVVREAEQGKPKQLTTNDIQLAIAERLERIAYVLEQMAKAQAETATGLFWEPAR